MENLEPFSLNQQKFSWETCTPHPDYLRQLSEVSEFQGAYYEPRRKLKVIHTIDADRHHLSISQVHRYPSWDEVYEARYRFLPGDIYVMQALPPKDIYVNQHPYCFHLWQSLELKQMWMMDQM